NCSLNKGLPKRNESLILWSFVAVECFFCLQD
ncbi:MAG: hypothetical protein ACI81A_002506, partial [Paraglaciecola sp.]